MQISGRICYLQLKLWGEESQPNQASGLETSGTNDLLWCPGVQLTSFSKRFVSDWGDSGRQAESPAKVGRKTWRGQQPTRAGGWSTRPPGSPRYAQGHGKASGSRPLRPSQVYWRTAPGGWGGVRHKAVLISTVGRGLCLLRAPHKLGHPSYGTWHSAPRVPHGGQRC